MKGSGHHQVKPQLLKWSFVTSFVNPAATPTWVFTPVAGLKSTLVMTNTSVNPVYFGNNNVSQFNGTLLAPNATVKIQNNANATYVASQVNTTATQYTMSAAALNAGSTVVTLSASATVAVNYLVLGTATSSEVVQVVTPGTASSFTIATATLYDHKASAVVTAANLAAGQITFNAGVH